MFNTLGNFSAVYFTLAAVLFVLILFEKHFIKLEEKIKAKKKTTNKAVKSAAYKKTAQNSALKNNHNRVTTIRRIPNNAA